MREHNFIVASTRPELLARQVNSFAKVRHGRVLKFFVFNDVEGRNSEFETAIDTIRRTFDENVVKIVYLPLTKQIEILTNFAKSAAPFAGSTPKQILACFEESGKLQGIRSIQNKSIILFYLLNKSRDSILHKVDDDIVAVNAIKLGNTVTIDKIDDFFSIKEDSLKFDDELISGSDYSIDTPSPLVDLIDFSEFFYNFFNSAKNKRKDQAMGDEYLAINPAKILSYSDPEKFLDVAPPKSTNTYGEVVLQIHEHLRVLESGNSRVTINDDGKDNVAKDTFFPGGCNSINYSYRPGLTPLFGNQDLLWELFELQRGKKIVVDGYVGHIKINLNRKPLLADLSDTSYKHQTQATYAVFDYLSQNFPSKATDEFGKQFIAQSNRWLEEVDTYVDGILDILADNSYWFRKDGYKAHTSDLQSFLELYQNQRENVKMNYSTHRADGKLLVDDYYKKNTLFLKLTDIAKTLPVITI